MATASILLPILAANPDPTDPPAYNVTTTTNRPYLAFDASTDEAVVWTFRMPENFASGLTAKIQWSGAASTTVTHTVRWAVEVMAVVPETGGAMDSDGFATSNEADDDILGTTAKRLQEVSITLTNDDGVAPDDYVAIRLARNADHANDDLNEDAWLWAVSLEYTTT